MHKLRRKKVFLLLLVLIVIVGLMFVEKLSPERCALCKTPRIERIKMSDALLMEYWIRSTPGLSQVQFLYNRRRSDQIGGLRSLPDTRDPICSNNDQEQRLATGTKVSVVIAFHNELRSTLLRTVMSIYSNTPMAYLHEIILVDDGSIDAELIPTLLRLTFAPFTANPDEAFPTANGREVAIRTQRNHQRLGLIESRNIGARLATGDFLFFIDSHCEVNVGWLEPLLEQIVRNGENTAVSPVLDSIDMETLEYRPSSHQFLGGFDWSLHFHWIPRREHQVAISVVPFRSPVFAGGIFLISRAMFFKLNGFNTQLEIWGGESIEFSLKLWLCGGQIEIVPCSRVGHIFRQQHSFQFPHGDAGQSTHLRNSKIIAESWLDAHKYFFYASKPAAKDIAVNISHNALNKLKWDLQCHRFAWYLQNVFPQLKLPNDDFVAFGTLSAEERCLQISNSYGGSNTSFAASAPAVQLLMLSCFRVDTTHWFLHRHSARLHSDTGACLNVVPTSSVGHMRATDTHFKVVLQYCRTTAHTQRWVRQGTQLIHAGSRLCLDNPLGDIVGVSQCRRVAPSQLFRFSMEVQHL